MPLPGNHISHHHLWKHSGRPFVEKMAEYPGTQSAQSQENPCSREENTNEQDICTELFILRGRTVDMHPRMPRIQAGRRSRSAPLQLVFSRLSAESIGNATTL